MDDVDLIRVMKALGDPKRFRMIQEIATAGELNCSQIGQRFDLSQPTVSHHLKLLTRAGLLRVRQQGQSHFIGVDEALLRKVFAFLPASLTSTRARKPSAARRRP